MAWYEIPGAEQDVALCTCARLSRNLEAFPFPARLEPAGAKEVISAVGAVLTENGFTAIDFAEISRTAACALSKLFPGFGRMRTARSMRSSSGAMTVTSTAISRTLSRSS